MKADKTTATLRRLRSQPIWSLLAADNAPVIVALLQAHLLEGERSLPASIFHERVGRDLEELRAQGADLPQTAQAYIAQWLSAGYIERRFPASAAEEQYELSSAATIGIRFIASLIEPRTAATESRLAAVIQQLVRLADETDIDPETRVAKLLAERNRIDREIEAVRQGRVKPLTDLQALERIREIILLADDLVEDFRRVREQFEGLNRDLRERIMDSEGNRGEVLNALFAGVDLIGESEAGRTFAAFWRLLTDLEQSATLEQALDQVLTREFARRLDPRERRFLLRLTRALLEQGGTVHEVLQSFARSLKQFVQSREYLEQRRLNQTVREAQSAALALKEDVKPTELLGYALQLSSGRVRSLSQWKLYDPALHTLEHGMRDGDAADLDLETVGGLIAQSEIDFGALRANIRATLEEQSQASIGDVLGRFPAAQGLGSVVGYIALGSKHGSRAEQRREIVSWRGRDEQLRRAHIPVIYFLKERLDEFA
jgi:hypothetical protein